MMKNRIYAILLLASCLLHSSLGFSQARVDFWLRDAITSYQEKQELTVKKSGTGIHLNVSAAQPMVDVIIQISKGDFSFVNDFNGIVQTVAGPYATARVPIGSIMNMAARDNLVYMAPHPILHPLNDLALAVTKMDSAITAGFTSRDVIVGIIDTGIDVKHPAFLDSAGHTRILYLWDQTQEGMGTERPGYDYGIEYTDAEIDAGQCNSVDNDGHGTHVAGSLAGYMYGHDEAKYHGGAIKANLIAVKGQVFLVDAINYIFEKAYQLGKPAVINISLGSHYGPHDGTDPFTAVRDYLTGPGRIIVQAAGNDGNHRIHHQIDADSDGEDMKFKLDSIADSLLFELWFDGSKNVDIKITGPRGIPNITVPAGSPGQIRSANGNLTIDNATQGPEFYNGAKRICIRMDSNIAAGDWSFRLFSARPVTIHAWMWSQDSENKFSFDTSDNHYTLVNDACSQSSIVVGALVSRTNIRDAKSNPINLEDFLGPVGTVAKFSSGGPTRDGRMKPDIIAPCGLMISAKSANVSSASLFSPDEFRSIGGRFDVFGVYQNWAMMGTSQATPHVTHAVAAMLQGNRKLSPSGTQAYLQKYAKRNLNKTWNYRTGHGIVSLEGFLQNLPRVTELRQAAPNEIQLTILSNQPLSGLNNLTNYQIMGPSSQRKVAKISQENAVLTLQLNGNLIEGVRDSLKISNIEGFAEPAIIEIDKLGTWVQPDFVVTNYIWHAEESPYYVPGTIQLPDWVTLTIEPGTTVKFMPDEQGPAEFQVFGRLKAEGTSDKPITFTSVNEKPGAWQGFYFDPGIPFTKMDYCEIKYANKAIVCYSDSLVIENSVIAHSKDLGIFVKEGNIAASGTTIHDTRGGDFQDAIQLVTSKALLENLTIYHNGRAGIASFGSIITIHNNTITDNDTFGIYIEGNATKRSVKSPIKIFDEKQGMNLNSNSTSIEFNNHKIRHISELIPYKSSTLLIENSIISHNNDIGIFSREADITVRRTIINHTRGGQSQDGIQLIDCNAILENLTLYDNGRAGIISFGSSTTMRDNIVVNNDTLGIYSDDGNADKISYSDVWNNGINFGNILKGAGMISGNPLFIDPAAEDFHLSINSPCINSGDPSSPLDPDGSRADMGALPFDPTPVEESDDAVIAKNTPKTFDLHTNYPNPFNPETTISYDIPKAINIEIKVFDINGKLINTLMQAYQHPGRYRLIWDGRNQAGVKLASGVYMIRLKADDFVKTIRTTLIR